MAAAVLCYINLLNYMNWFIIAGEEGQASWATLPIYPLAVLGNVISLLSSPLAMPT